MNDTPPEIRKKRAAIIFNMSPQERLRQGFEMMEFVSNTVKNSIRQEHPRISELALKIKFFQRYYDKEFSEEAKKRIFEHFRSTTDGNKPFAEAASRPRGSGKI